MLRSLLPIARACRYCQQRTALRSYAAAASATSTAESPSSKITHSPSILKAGTVMKDLSVLKDKPDPVALPDEEYPSWLWTLTDEYAAAKGRQTPQSATDKDGVEGAFNIKAEKKKLRATNRAEIKSRNFLRTT